MSCSTQQQHCNSRCQRFTGRVVIVTGSSSGIGADAAVAFGREGASVVLHGQSAERLKRTVDALHAVGVGDERIASVIGSMQDEATPRRIVQTAMERFGKIDVLVNNAGMSGKLADYEPNSMEICDILYAVNFRSAAQLMKLAMPHLIATKGNVINVSSVSGSGDFTFPPDDAFYCALKAALTHLSKVFASIYGPQGVRVNVLSPGPIASSILDKGRGIIAGLGDGRLDEWAQRATVLGRGGHPSETSTMITFLASDEASFVTGAEMVVDGGVMVKGPPTF
jgi:meso-butanediol dehydrogenase/(S,S)-butanediol dehydrogenase/diacetyl reductase